MGARGEGGRVVGRKRETGGGMEGGGERERGRERERMRKQVRASFPIMNIKLEIKPYSVLNVPPLFLLFLQCRKE